MPSSCQSACKSNTTKLTFLYDAAAGRDTHPEQRRGGTVTTEGPRFSAVLAQHSKDRGQKLNPDHSRFSFGLFVPQSSLFSSARKEPEGTKMGSPILV